MERSDSINQTINQQQQQYPPKIEYIELFSNLMEMSDFQCVDFFIKNGLVPLEYKAYHLNALKNIGRNLYVESGLTALKFGKTPGALFKWTISQYLKMEKK